MHLISRSTLWAAPSRHPVRQSIIAPTSRRQHEDMQRRQLQQEQQRQQVQHQQLQQLPRQQPTLYPHPVATMLRRRPAMMIRVIREHKNFHLPLRN